MAISWNRFEQSYISGECGKFGKYAIFHAYYDACAPKCQDNKIKLTCKLPGIKSFIGHFSTTDDAKEKASEIADYWMKNSGFEFSEKMEITEK